MCHDNIASVYEAINIASSYDANAGAYVKEKFGAEREVFRKRQNPRAITEEEKKKNEVEWDKNASHYYLYRYDMFIECIEHKTEADKARVDKYCNK